MMASLDAKHRDKLMDPSNSTCATWDILDKATISSERKMADDTFSSLNWSNWRLCGRQNEVEQLEGFYLTRKDSDLVIVTGPMGIGKTAITESLHSRVQDDAGVLARGAFSSMSQPQPYAAFVEAFTDLVEQLQLKNDYETIQNDLKQAIAQSGAERFLISDGLSVLGTLMNDDIISERSLQQQQCQHQQQKISATERQQRFVNALTKIVEAIGSVFPFVLVLDNIHSADLGSIQLLESLCMNGKLSNVLLVATCRDEEVGFHHPLSVKLRSMEDRGIRLADIHAPPLTEDQVYDLIVTLTSEVPRDEVLRESTVMIHRSTGGNPLLVCELLGVIETERFASGRLNRRLRYEDFIDAKMSQIPSSRPVLQLMACLGEKMVHESVLTELLPDMQDGVRSDVLAAQQQGLLTVSAESGDCKFAQGNMQAAVYNLIPREERSAIHYDIAERLCNWLTEEHIEENIFLMVDQYMKGSDSIPTTEGEKVADLCLRAAQKAASSAAFSSAGDFIRCGLSLLVQRTKWRDTYSLTLALMNVAIELEFCHGNHDAVDKLHEEISHESRTAMDSVTSYTIHISSLGSRGRLEEAIVESKNILALLGEKIPQRFLLLRTMNGLLKMKKLLKATSDEEIMGLPSLNDARIQAVSNILHLMFVYTFMLQSELVPIVSMRLIELTRQYGLNSMSAASFGIFGMVEMMALREYEEGYRLGKLALKLAESINCQEMKSRTYTPVYGFLTSYKEPLRDSVGPLEQAYKLNILTGDVEMAITSMSLSKGNSFQAGFPLFQCISGLREVLDACELHNQHWNQRIVRMSIQYAVNLSGRNNTNSPFELTGEYMTESLVEMCIIKEKNDVQLSWLYFLKYMMAVYLCDIPTSLRAERLTKPLKKYSRQSAFYNLQSHAFHEGMIACFLATAIAKDNVRKCRRFLARAERRLRRLQSFALICPTNYRNKAVLLEAEIESVRREKTSSEVSCLYRKAAEIASDEGFLHEQALALEKGGRFLFHISIGSQQSHSHEARSFVKDAIEVYDKYGSMLKVDQLSRLLDAWSS